MFAGILFISTSICGAMPGFQWNILMCLLMGIGAGGMLPILVLLIVPLSGIGSLVAVVTAYGSEIYPTRIRSRGTGWVAGMTKAGGVFIPALVVAAAATPSLAETALLGAIPLLLATVLFGRTAPDTQQRGLEEIIRTEPVVAVVEQAA